MSNIDPQIKLIFMLKLSAKNNTINDCFYKNDFFNTFFEMNNPIIDTLR